MTHPLIQSWRSLNLKKPPYILQGDKEAMANRSVEHRTLKEYVRSGDFRYPYGNKFHLGLLPVPYDGDILRAKVYILSLNPGFNPDDYYAETECKKFRRARIATLRQKNMGDFPCVSLNPDFCWHGGWSYWVERFKPVLDLLPEKWDFRRRLQFLSKNVAFLEYLPYHSAHYELPETLAQKTESSQSIRRFVHDVVLKRAKSGKALVLVVRHAKEWGLKKGKHIIIFKGAETRAARLNKYAKRIAQMVMK